MCVIDLASELGRCDDRPRERFDRLSLRTRWLSPNHTGDHRSGLVAGQLDHPKKSTVSLDHHLFSIRCDLLVNQRGEIRR